MTPARATAGRDAELWSLLRAIATDQNAEVSQRLAASPRLAVDASPAGATRAQPERYYLAEIGHDVYTGDTALHVAAAAYRTEVAEELVALGADVAARNRRGAQPLHCAAMGQPGAESWDASAQADTVGYLLRAGHPAYRNPAIAELLREH